MKDEITTLKRLILVASLDDYPIVLKVDGKEYHVIFSSKAKAKDFIYARKMGKVKIKDVHPDDIQMMLKTLFSQLPILLDVVSGKNGEILDYTEIIAPEVIMN